MPDDVRSRLEPPYYFHHHLSRPNGGTVIYLWFNLLVIKRATHSFHKYKKRLTRFAGYHHTKEKIKMYRGRMYSEGPVPVVKNRAVATTVPKCTCWANPASGPEGSPSAWRHEIFDGIAGTAAFVGARAFMCRMDVSEGYRQMHISLADGRVHIDIPLLADTPPNIKGPSALYVQSSYCTVHRRVESESLFREQPNSPIKWIQCKSSA
jgi:hypothetical protein